MGELFHGDVLLDDSQPPLDPLMADPGCQLREQIGHPEPVLFLLVKPHDLYRLLR